MAANRAPPVVEMKRRKDTGIEWRRCVRPRSSSTLSAAIAIRRYAVIPFNGRRLSNSRAYIYNNTIALTTTRRLALLILLFFRPVRVHVFRKALAKHFLLRRDTNGRPLTGRGDFFISVRRKDATKRERGE